MPSLRSIIQVLLLALIAPYLYDRYVAFSPMVANRPSVIKSLRNFKSHAIKYQDQLRNCEDVIMVEDLGLAFLSCDPGRDRWNTVMGTFKPAKNSADHGGLWVYDYATPNLPDTDRLRQLSIDEPDLHPLGLAFDPSTSTLYMVNHARHSKPHILILHLDTHTLSTTLVAKLAHPLLHAPNSIQVLGRNTLYVTNDHAIRAATSPLLSKLETFSGAPGGSVVYMNTREPAAAKVVARVPFANGITLLNATTLAVASSSKAGVYLFQRKGPKELELKSVVRTPAAVDNLSKDAEGRLLMAGHPFAPALMHVSKGRARCDLTGSAEETKACTCTAPSWAAEWSQEGGLKEVYKDDGTEFCSSSTIVRDVKHKVGIISGLYERGLLVFEA